MKLLFVFISIFVAYLFGSIPFALILGKLFYKVDIRNYGSKNLGGTNAGRVLGKPLGIIVTLLDASKCVITVLIIVAVYPHFFSQENITVGYLTATVCLAGLFCGIGHCYPVFAQFRGGKAVSTSFGFIIITNFVIGLVCLATFCTTLLTSKYVSLASLVTAFTAFVFAWIFYILTKFVPFFLTFGVLFGTNVTLAFAISVTVIVALIFIKHIPNIKRLLTKTERKIGAEAPIINIKKD